MSDTFGALPIPLVAPSSLTDPVADPLLGVTLSFFRAVLNANAPAAWRAVYKDIANAPVVKATFSADPQKAPFTTNDLPALFIDRETVADPVRLADDWLTQESILRVTWLLPVGIIQKRDLRNSMVNGIARVLLQAVERSRDPAWVVTNDPDPRAALEGSIFSTFGGWMEFLVGAWKPFTLVLQVTGETSSQNANQPRYEGLSLACKVTEKLNEDLTRFDPIGPLALTLTTPDGLVLGVSELT